MPDTQREILAWLHKQPDWLQQAAETLLSSSTVSESDIQGLVERLKAPEGHRVTTHRAFSALRSAAEVSSELRLLEVGAISGIENLGPRIPLTFGAGNLCVIYGHNGSGKSGYTRILKKVCGKPGAVDLKADVFKPTPTSRQCRIGYKVDGAEYHDDWPANGASIDRLRVVDIFDADAAQMYLTKETVAAYVPPVVELFQSLASVCDQIKGKLQADQDRLVSALPALPKEYAATLAGIAYGGLKQDLDEQDILRLVEWGAKDKQALEQLTDRLKVVDPAAQARAKRAIKGHLDKLHVLVRAAADALSDEQLSAIRTLRADATAKRRIATESASVAAAKLDGVGTDTWRALWEAARSYSQTAYAGRAYPVTDDALCVLCHQELKPEAQQRLRDFEGFVQGKLEADAKSAEVAYQDALGNLPTALTDEQVATWCQAAGLLDERWMQRVGSFWSQVCRADAALLAGETSEMAARVEAPGELLNEMSALSGMLETEAEQHDRDAQMVDRAQIAKEKLSLEARQWVSQQAVAIRAEIARLKQIASYEAWKRAANSRPISLKAGEIAEQVVTDAFVKRFNGELKALGAHRIRVELVKTRIDRGKALHVLRLKGVVAGSVQPQLVLSEGERRIVSLAAFLADVAEQPHSAPFIFDDPISSLDHDFEWHVATRLVMLAMTRQVVVFTHRLSLYGAIEDAAKKIGERWMKQHLQQCCIESYSGVSGHPADEQVWNADTARANDILLDRLTSAKNVGDESGAEAYRGLAQGICSEFRKLLERTVEADLLNKVVVRHRRSVTTEGRLGLLSSITSEDCKLIDDMMTKYSRYEHSQSSEVPTFIPEESELRKDLEALKGWRASFKRRSVAPQ
jgi:energy-coupling factor transporter ATP-binding protein EcfA2